MVDFDSTGIRWLASGASRRDETLHWPMEARGRVCSDRASLTWDRIIVIVQHSELLGLSEFMVVSEHRGCGCHSGIPLSGFQRILLGDSMNIGSELISEEVVVLGCRSLGQGSGWDDIQIRGIANDSIVDIISPPDSLHCRQGSLIHYWLL